MGIKAGTTLTVTFNAQQIAQLDCLLQDCYWQAISETNVERKAKIEERINNVYTALNVAGYR